MSKVLMAAVLLLAACDYSVERYIPMTAEERECVQEQQAKILSATPDQLGGDDQDWDDAIQAAHVAACRACCPRRIWKFDGFTHEEIGGPTP